MRRRQFMLALAGGLAGFSGCSGMAEDTPLDSGPANSPWDSETVTVAKGGLTGQVADEDGIIRRALVFWTDNAETYLDYPVKFDYTPQMDDPDIRVEFVAEVTSCGDDHDEQLAGCAPFLDGGSAPDTATARIEVTDDADDLLHVIKHEVGHILGLGHDDSPQEVMSNDPAARIDNYDAKKEIVDEYGRATRSYNDAMGEYKSGLADWREGRYSDVSPSMSAAAEGFEKAAEVYGRAAQRASDIGEAEAADMLARSKDRSTHLAEASRHLESAADAYADGDQKGGDSLFEDYQKAYEKADEIEMPSGDRLVKLLNLD